MLCGERAKNRNPRAQNQAHIQNIHTQTPLSPQLHASLSFIILVWDFHLKKYFEHSLHRKKAHKS